MGQALGTGQRRKPNVGERYSQRFSLSARRREALFSREGVDRELCSPCKNFHPLTLGARLPREDVGWEHRETLCLCIGSIFWTMYWAWFRQAKRLWKEIRGKDGQAIRNKLRRIRRKVLRKAARIIKGWYRMGVSERLRARAESWRGALKGGRIRRRVNAVRAAGNTIRWEGCGTEVHTRGGAVCAVAGMKGKMLPPGGGGGGGKACHRGSARWIGGRRWVVVRPLATKGALTEVRLLLKVVTRRRSSRPRSRSRDTLP